MVLLVKKALPGDVPEEGNQSEVDEKQIIKSATVYRIARYFRRIRTEESRTITKKHITEDENISD